MAFWGVEVTPTRRHLHRFNPTLGRLHISQATLGNGNENGISKSVLQCNVGDKAPILLCCLTPQKTDCCCLNLEFEEEGVDVIFSVVGPTSVHLAGYYLPHNNAIADGDDTDSHGEDIADTESEYSDEVEDNTYDTGDGFIDDRDILETYSSSPSPSPSPLKSRVMIKKTNGRRSKRLKKKFQVSDSDGDNHKPIILGGTTSIFDSDSDNDDQDTSPRKPKKFGKKMTNKDDGQLIGAKRKCQDSPDGDTQRGIEVPNESSVPFSEVGKEISEKRKKKKKKGHTKEVKISGVVDGSMIDVHFEETTQKQVAKMDDITLVEPVSEERCSDDKEVDKANKSGPLSSAENEPKKKGKKKRGANEEKTQAGGTDDKAQMQEAHLVGITNDDHVIDADAAAGSGGKKKKKKSKKKAGDESKEETDNGRK